MPPLDLPGLSIGLDRSLIHRLIISNGSGIVGELGLRLS